MRQTRGSKNLAAYFRDPNLDADEVLGPPATGLACRNIRHALRLLGYPVKFSDHFDGELEQAVLAFQTQNHHASLDGHVGPGTRQLLSEELIKQHGRKVFLRMKRPGEHRVPSVFLSYAWNDKVPVLAVDQWLRSQGLRVIIDERNFAAGESIRDEIIRWIEISDIVVCFVSRNSIDRPYPLLEREIAHNRQIKGSGHVIYVKLDDVTTDVQHEHRIFIPAFELTFDETCARLMQGVKKTVRPGQEINLASIRQAGANWTSVTSLDDALMLKIRQLPEESSREVEDFVAFQMARRGLSGER